MHAINAFSLLALAGSAVAAPGGWRNVPDGVDVSNGDFARPGQNGQWRGPPQQNSNNNYTPAKTEVAVVTQYTTVTYGGNFGGRPTATPTAIQQPQAPESTWTEWTSSAAAPTASAAPPSSGNQDGYMAIVSEWRSKLGLSQLQQDGQLQANAEKTASDGQGEMKHWLGPGSMGQVLAPGSPSEFEHVFVGGWLCEISTLPGLNGVCAEMSKGWDYAGQDGHAKILTDPKYSKIGCGNVGNIWACDLA